MRKQTGWDRMLANASRLMADATRIREHVGEASTMAAKVRDGVDAFAATGVDEGMPPGLPAREDGGLSPEERRHAAGLMRVNHVGEICAQALYQGQAATARTGDLRGYLLGAADEEKRHLDWTARRIAELGSRPSRLVPFWFASSWLIGAAAGMRGDRASLGFMAETERQVEAHLAGHLGSLPPADARSRGIVRQMQIEEIGHAEGALARGGRLPPLPIRGLMKMMGKVMTTTAYRDHCIY